MTMILIGLGSNLSSAIGTPSDALRAALLEMARRGVGVLAVSPFYQSPAWPDPLEPAYTNAVAMATTVLGVADLMHMLLDIERAFGRVRGLRRYAPRVLDLDLLAYDEIVSLPDDPVVVPHPRLAERAFVLKPLMDLAPEWEHPRLGLTVGEMLAALGDDAANAVRNAVRAA